MKKLLLIPLAALTAALPYVSHADWVDVQSPYSIEGGHTFCASNPPTAVCAYMGYNANFGNVQSMAFDPYCGDANNNQSYADIQCFRDDLPQGYSWVQIPNPYSVDGQAIFCAGHAPADVCAALGGGYLPNYGIRIATAEDDSCGADHNFKNYAMIECAQFTGDQPGPQMPVPPPPPFGGNHDHGPNGPQPFPNQGGDNHDHDHGGGFPAPAPVPAPLPPPGDDHGHDDQGHNGQGHGDPQPQPQPLPPQPAPAPLPPPPVPMKSLCSMQIPGVGTFSAASGVSEAQAATDTRNSCYAVIIGSVACEGASGPGNKCEVMCSSTNWATYCKTVSDDTPVPPPAPTGEFAVPASSAPAPAPKPAPAPVTPAPAPKPAPAPAPVTPAPAPKPAPAPAPSNPHTPPATPNPAHSGGPGQGGGEHH